MLLKITHKPLKKFTWQGRDAKGISRQGEVEAISIAFAKAALHHKGMHAIKIKKKNIFIMLLLFNKKIPFNEVTLFFRQLATLYRAGIPLLQALIIIERSCTHEKLRALIKKIKMHIETGHTLASALQQYPIYFNQLSCSLINIGETSGTLDIMLDKIVSHQEKIALIKSKIKKASFYPLTVLIVSIMLTSALLIYVVPQFAALFKNFSAELPLLTQWIIYLAQGMQQITGWGIICLIVSILIFFTFKKRSPIFAYKIDHYKLKIPLIGKLLQHAIIARYARTLTISYNAGLPLTDALKLIANTTGNLVYSQACERISEKIAAGNSIQQTMAQQKIFPDMAIQMIATGEESGSLEMMLTKIADFYEQKINDAIDNLGHLLEPMIMLVLGSLIGIIVIAMYLPIFKLGSVM